MSHAIVLFRAPGADEWTRQRTVEFKTRATSYKTVRCGIRDVDLQHAALAGHTLILTDGETRVVLWSTGGNEPDDTVPKALYDLPVVGHYDLAGPEGKTYRIYHSRHQKERRW